MQQDLWGERKSYRCRRRKRAENRTSKIPYSITGSNDCEIIGHTVSFRDLAGCTVCMDCGARIFCPCCIERHPTDETAIAILCEMHERQVQHAV